MRKLAENNPTELINVLNERLCFERSGVRLYDAILAKIRLPENQRFATMLDQLLEHREQEKEHEEWLEQQIRSLGGDAHGETELSRLVEAESAGIERIVLNGDPEIPHLLHALLAAELVDNEGWVLLVNLAKKAGDRDAKREFSKRLAEEETHLKLLERAMTQLQREKVLGEPAELPSSP